MTRGEQKARRSIYVVLSLGTALAPIALTAYNLLNPLVRGNGREMIAAYTMVNPTTNGLHLMFGVLTGLLLPVSAIGMGVLAYPRMPMLATIGGLMGFLGWMPWLALIAQEALTTEMARLGGGSGYAALWNAFDSGEVMRFYLLFYIVLHLISVVVLAWAMRRARVTPAWAAWALGLTSPLSMVLFPLNARFPRIGGLGFDALCLLFVLGSFPPAINLWRQSVHANGVC